MDAEMFERRHILKRTAALAGITLAGSIASPLAWAALPPTSQQTSGPFYPSVLPSDRDMDLTSIAGRDGRAKGQIIELAGQVLDAKGTPVSGARVEIWQANSHGRYAHPRDPADAPLDPNFLGYGAVETDAEGRYGFRTIKPGSYPTGAGGWVRPPHIHFAVAGRRERLITQMYFPGEPLNDVDRLLNGAGNRDSLIAAITPSGDVLGVQWDIVLARG
ncbi:MAG: dioxygenase family protein [Alphaproteobacteria bacterium]